MNRTVNHGGKAHYYSLTIMLHDFCELCAAVDDPDNMKSNDDEDGRYLNHDNNVIVCICAISKNF